MPDWIEEDDRDDEAEIEDGGDDELDDEPTIACYHCGRQIHEDAERCPYCEQYLSEEDAPAERKPWWIVLGVVVALYMVYRWIVG